MNRDSYFEDSRARCLNEHYPHQSDDLYLIMCGLENCSPDKEVWDHVRIGYHLHVIMSGEGVIQVGDRRQLLHAGQLFLIKPGEQMMYRPRPENPWTYCWMTFDGARASSYIEEAGFTTGVNSLNSHVDISRFYHKCDQVMGIPQLNMAAALRRLGLTMEFISLAVESYDISMRDVRGRHKALYNQADYVNHAKDYILNNYSSINVADISMYLGIDRSYFSAIFSNTYARLGQGSDFYNGFVEAAGYDLSTGVVEIDCANYCKPSGRATGNTYYEKLISMLDGKVDDVWVAEAEDVIAIGETGRLMDLNTNDALKEKYSARFVYCTPLDESYSDQPVPIGIDLSGTALVGEYSAYPNGAVLGVNAYTQRPDQVVVFLDYLFK